VIPPHDLLSIVGGDNYPSKSNIYPLYEHEFWDGSIRSRTSNISRQIPIPFAFNSGDSFYGTHLSTKNLRSISFKTRKIVGFGMNKSLAISRHEA
jgi:hypothetical protein